MLHTTTSYGVTCLGVLRPVIHCFPTTRRIYSTPLLRSVARAGNVTFSVPLAALMLSIPRSQLHLLEFNSHLNRLATDPLW